MSEKQLREKVIALEKELNIYKTILQTPKDGKMGRPIGSIKYTDVQVMWLKDNKNMPMTNLVMKFNERFGTKLSVTSRALYNFMCREGIIQYDQRGEIDRYEKQGTEKKYLK
jgi:hypothetical protein